jgi:uncharacterized repeat protein (TIGR03833 family)
VPTDRPTRDEIEPGLTVTVEQEQENNEGEPLVGEVRQVLTEEHSHPGGVQVELESGVTGRVKAIGEEAIEE